MRVKIRVYGELAAKIGSELELDVNKFETVENILNRVLKKFGLKIDDILQDYQILVNGEVVDKGYKVSGGEEIAVFPIYAGGD